MATVTKDFTTEKEAEGIIREMGTQGYTLLEQHTYLNKEGHLLFEPPDPIDIFKTDIADLKTRIEKLEKK